MAPSLDVSNCWAKETRDGTPVVITMENPNFSVVEIDGNNASEFQPLDKGHGKNAKQVTWVLLLKAHRTVGCLSWLATGLCSLFGAIKKRFSCKRGGFEEGNKPSNGRMMFMFIRGFLVISLAFLAFEMVAYWNGWHFQKPNLRLPENLHIPKTNEIQGWMHAAYISLFSILADSI